MVNTHRIENVKLKSKHIHTVQRKINNKKVSLLFQFLARVVVKCFNIRIASYTIYVALYISYTTRFFISSDSICLLCCKCLPFIIESNANHQWLKICWRQPKELNAIKRVKRRL